MAAAPTVGLFVGGRGSRLGGVAKGTLRHPSGARLIDRLIEVVRSALPDAPIVLVGERVEYADLGLASVADSPAGIGPLGGLRALLALALATKRDAALALACDMPYVTHALVKRLAEEHPEALALAPQEDGRWHALAARFSVRALPALDAAIAAGEHSLQGIFARLGDGACVLSVDESELGALRDWDSPADVAS